MGMGGLFQTPDPYDKPFKREELDMPRLGFAMYGLGYRPFQLTRQFSGEKQVVWAKSEEEVLSYAEGDVKRIPAAPMGQSFVLVLDKKDGGGTNVNGTFLPCQTCGK